MAGEYSPSDIEFITQAIVSGTAVKFRSRDGTEFWVLPDGQHIPEPHLNFCDLPRITSKSSRQAVWEAMKAKGALPGVRVGSLAEEKQKKKKLW